MRRRLLLSLLLLCSAPVLAQGLPTSKPPPLGAPMQQAPQPGAGAPPRCAAPLAQGCMTQQASCQMACPPMWSTNPGAPAFTPTDRAGCMQRCFHGYLACQRLYGC